MSKAPIRNKKYAKAIRLGVILGKKYANEYGQHSTRYTFMWAVAEKYNLHFEASLFGLAYDTAWQVFDKERINLIKNVWTVEESYAREEKANFLNMDRDEQEDYLLRKEVESLRAEVKSWNKLVGVNN